MDLGMGSSFNGDGWAQQPGGGSAHSFAQSALVPDPQDLPRIDELRGELDRLNPLTNKLACALLLKEIEKIENRMDPEYLEVDIPKPVKLVRKVLVPSHRHPKFNFVGKILGPGGKTLQAMAKQFKCHIYVLGRGATKDRAKEEELLNSGDPKHAHFRLPLHVKIETECPPVLAHQRVTAVLAQLEKILQPVRDELVASQMEELGFEFNPNPAFADGRGRGRGGPGRPMGRGQGGGRGGPMGGRGRAPPPPPPPFHQHHPPQQPPRDFHDYNDYTDYSGGGKLAGNPRGRGGGFMNRAAPY